MAEEEPEVEPAEQPARRRAGLLALDLGLGRFDEPPVRDPGRTHRLAGTAIEAEREMAHRRVAERDAPLSEGLDEEDASARRVHLRAEL